MATIADNVRSMAALVAEVKKDHRLTENTVMRIIDMNFALAQSAGMPSLSGDEQMPSFEEGPDQQMRMFPDDLEAAVARWTEENPDAVEEARNPTNDIDEDEVLATTDHPLEN